MSEPDHSLSYEELKERRQRRRLIWGLPLAGALLAGLYLTVPTAVRGIKGWQSRRLAREAGSLIAHEQWREASIKAGDALRLRGTEPEAWRVVGQLLTRTRQPVAALTWWRKLAETHRLTGEDRRDYATAALSAGALPEAATQVEALLAPGVKPGPADALLAAQLASRQEKNARAANYARQALDDERSQPNQRMSAILLLLTTAARDSMDYAAAWAQLLRWGRDPANPMSLDALTCLADPQFAAPLGVRPLFPATANPDATAPGMTPGEIADTLDTHPRARPQDHLLAWELRVGADPAHADQLLAEAGPRFGQGDDHVLANLTQFLNARGHADTTLQVLSPTRAAQTPELSLAYIDALAALGRWQDIKDAFAADHLRLNAMAQHTYLAVARAKTGEPEGAEVEWQRAQEAAEQDGGKLTALAAYEEKMGAFDAADAAYAAAIAVAPEQRADYTARVQLARRRGQTALAREVLAGVVSRWPDDMKARADLGYLDLLLGTTGDAVRSEWQAALPLALPRPADWTARATLALARLRDGQFTAAWAAFSGDHGIMDPQARPGAEVPPGAQAVWAATLAANGWRTEAEAAARRLSDSALLPEERALIAPVLTPVAKP